MSAQQFDADLFAEESAQTKYYEMKASARPFIEPKLVPQQKKLMQMASHDNISIHSAPTLTRSTSGGHHVMTASSPTAVRLRKWAKSNLIFRLGTYLAFWSQSYQISRIPP